MPQKAKNIFVCSNCDAQFPKWSGRCLDCGSWGSLQPKTVEDKKNNKIIEKAEIIDLNNIKSTKLERLDSGINEINRVLGGGFVPGSLILLAGEPGIGKSTIVAQIADNIGKKIKNKKVVYVSGEESATQIKDRLQRLNCDLRNILFIGNTNAEKVINTIKKEDISLVIIDSIQTIYSFDVLSESGSISQIRATTSKFLEFAKQNDVPVFLIGHITKDGQVAGPKALEHIVDTVIYLESETEHDFRVLRASKNRFGSVNELGIFEMTNFGFKEVKDPSLIFIDSERSDITGSVISSIMEGTRPFLVEIQALVTKTVFGYPQRKASGFDLNRLQVLVSVLTKRASINLTNQDVIVNIVGGLKVNDPALDLAVCASIISSLLNIKINRKTIFLGEVGLGGEVRNISKIEERLKEAKKLGFKNAFIPNAKLNINNMEVKNIKSLEELASLLIK